MARQIGLFTDTRTGEVLGEWRNPFIDETVKVVNVAMEQTPAPVSP
jgi:hypothetical protein